MTTRRTLLRASGISLALPWLESLRRENLAAAAEPPRKRFVAYYVPCGIHMPGWTPAIAGARYALTPILQPLAPVRDNVLVISGLANRPAQPDGPGDHASGTAAFLTAAHPYKTDGVGIKNGVSVDQKAASVLGKATRFPSLQIGMDAGGSVGDCDSGYSCAYARNISWASESQPLPKIVNPKTVFDQLFGGTDPKASRAEAEKRRRYRTSILDYVSGDSTRLRARLGRTDQRKIDEYLSGVREIETRIAGESKAPMCDTGDRPIDNPAEIPRQMKTMTDLMVIALQCDLTRIISFMLAHAATSRVYTFLALSQPHHELSHHMGDPAKLAALQAIGTWEVAQLSYFLQRLKAIDDGNGATLLDNTCVFFSGEISDGDRHNHDNMPVLLAGGLGGAIKTGRHLVVPQERSFGDLFVTILRGMGVEISAFGNSTAPLELT